MNDEIKEILDNVRKCCDITKDQSFVVYQRQDMLKLLDYITNLQHTKEYLGEVLHEQELEQQDYKSRIEKAVEYIKEDMYSEPNELYGLIDGEHLLNILNGKE